MIDQCELIFAKVKIIFSGEFINKSLLMVSDNHFYNGGYTMNGSEVRLHIIDPPPASYGRMMNLICRERKSQKCDRKTKG